MERDKWLRFYDIIIRMDKVVVENGKTDLHNEFALAFIDVKKELSNEKTTNEDYERKLENIRSFYETGLNKPNLSSGEMLEILIDNELKDINSHYTNKEEQNV